MTNVQEPIRFAPLAEAGRTSWRRPRLFEFASVISQIPLSDSEILLTSHHLPIAIDYADEGLHVVAITHPRFQRTPAIDADGRWQKGYMPIALRCLPFRNVRAGGGKQCLEIALNLAEAPEQAGAPVFAADGGLSAEVTQIAALLSLLEEGKRRLQAAAEKLLIADVLAAFQLGSLPHGSAEKTRSFTVDRNKFSALSNARMAHLGRDGFLPIDLAVACIFSQRLMPTLVSVATDEQSGVRRAIETRYEDITPPLRANVQIDDSELFSFQRFAETDRRHGE
jgi:hypothetical protein